MDTIDPFEEHPDHEGFLKKKKNYLTKRQILNIVDSKMEEVSRKDPPTWGFSKYELITILIEIKRSVEEHQ